jgi:hypothetical protein
VDAYFERAPLVRSEEETRRIPSGQNGQNIFVHELKLLLRGSIYALRTNARVRIEPRGNRQLAGAGFVNTRLAPVHARSFSSCRVK